MQLRLGLSFLLVAGLVMAVTLGAPLVAGPPWDRLIIILGGSLVALGAAWILSSRLTRHIRRLAGVAAVISQGDLTRTLQQDAPDEVGELARAFNAMLSSLLNIVREVRSTAEEIFESAQALSATAAEMNATTREISRAAQSIAGGAGTQAEMARSTTAITRDMARSVGEVADRARSAFTFAREAGERARTGREDAAAAKRKIGEIAEQIETATASVAGFRESALEINKIVAFITQVAQQTHMLSLNASIEATRAGDHGSGFAVIAGEVRKLADNARTFAGRIAALAEQINDESGRVIGAMEDSTSAAREGREVVEAAAGALDSISGSMLSTVERIREITELSARQSDDADKLVGAIEEISRIARGNAEGLRDASNATNEQTQSMREMTGSAQKLARTSDHLKDLISIFRVD